MNNYTHTFESFLQERYSKLYEDEQQTQSTNINPLDVFGTLSLFDTDPSNIIKTILSLNGTDLKTKFNIQSVFWLIQTVVNGLGTSGKKYIDSVDTKINNDNIKITINSSNSRWIFHITKEDISRLTDNQNILDIPVYMGRVEDDRVPPHIIGDTYLLGILLLCNLDTVDFDITNFNYDSLVEKGSQLFGKDKTFYRDATQKFYKQTSQVFVDNINKIDKLAVLKDVKKHEGQKGYLNGADKLAFVEKLSKGSDLVALLNLKSEKPKELTKE